MTTMVVEQFGKIEKVAFGRGGYDDAMIGVSFVLSGVGWGVHDFWGSWSASIQPTARTRWTEASRRDELGGVVLRLDTLLAAAKVTTVAALAGVPIAATFEGNSLRPWRVLTEVL